MTFSLCLFSPKRPEIKNWNIAKITIKTAINAYYRAKLSIVHGSKDGQYKIGTFRHSVREQE